MKLLITVIWIILLIACSSAKVLRADKADGIDLGNYKTFDFYKTEVSGDTTSSKFRDRSRILMQAITDELTRRGYVQSNVDPDLLVNIGIVVKEQIQTRETNFREDAPKYIGQRRYSWQSKEVEVGRYKVGTATVDLVDGKENKLVWQGVVEGIVPEKDQKAEQLIREGIRTLFEKYPVTPRS